MSNLACHLKSNNRECARSSIHSSKKKKPHQVLRSVMRRSMCRRWDFLTSMIRILAFLRIAHRAYRLWCLHFFLMSVSSGTKSCSLHLVQNSLCWQQVVYLGWVGPGSLLCQHCCGTMGCKQVAFLPSCQDLCELLEGNVKQLVDFVLWFLPEAMSGKNDLTKSRLCHSRR